MPRHVSPRLPALGRLTARRLGRAPPVSKACASIRRAPPLASAVLRRYSSYGAEGAGTTFQREPENREFVHTLEFLDYDNVPLFQVMDEDGDIMDPEEEDKMREVCPCRLLRRCGCPP